MAEVMPYIVSALGGGGLGLAIKAILDWRAVRAKANLDDTSAAVSLTKAATELLNPLRTELAARERQVLALRDELDVCTQEAQALRNELAMARVEADALRREREQDRARIRVLEDMLRRR